MDLSFVVQCGASSAARPVRRDQCGASSAARPVRRVQCGASSVTMSKSQEKKSNFLKIISTKSPFKKNTDF